MDVNILLLSLFVLLSVFAFSLALSSSHCVYCLPRIYLLQASKAVDASEARRALLTLHISPTVSCSTKQQLYRQLLPLRYHQRLPVSLLHT